MSDNKVGYKLLTDHVPRPQQAFFVGGPDHPSITEVPNQRAEMDNAGQCKRHVEI